jgi:YidC/Oxa1 family membrane protein insertase
MNIKDILITLSLALALSWTLRYFLGAPQQQARVVAAENKPFNLDVDFAELKDIPQPTLTHLETSYGRLLFSTEGALLQALTFKRMVDHTSVELQTIAPLSLEQDRGAGCFLVALDEQTPFYFNLIKQQELDHTFELVYQANGEQATIEKAYTIYKDSNKIDLTLTLKPRPGLDNPIRPRVIFAAPAEHLKRPEQRGAVVEERDAKLVKYQESRDRVTLQNQAWQFPLIFGAEDRYFLHALIADEQSFVQRGYFKAEVLGHLTPILEGPVVKKDTTWKLSFYLGPKEHEELVAVDQQLERVLDYGFLVPLAKPILYLMKWMNKHLHNFGLVIVLLTILIRLLLLPITVRGAKGAEKMRELDKKLRYIKQKYKDDQAALEREQTELYKKYGLSGLGGLVGGGCLPLLLQIPVFFAMNRVLSSSIELYKAPFLWIPDLSAADPYYVLPMLVALSMVVTAFTASDAQQRLSGMVMAVVFGAFSVGFSAGLALYIAVGSFIGAAQVFIQKALNHE